MFNSSPSSRRSQGEILVLLNDIIKRNGISALYDRLTVLIRACRRHRQVINRVAMPIIDTQLTPWNSHTLLLKKNRGTESNRTRSRVCVIANFECVDPSWNRLFARLCPSLTLNYFVKVASASPLRRTLSSKHSRPVTGLQCRVGGCQRHMRAAR